MRTSSIFLGALLLSVAACGGGEEETATGMLTATVTDTSGATTTTGDGDGDTTDTTTGDGDGDGTQTFAGTLYLNFDGAELTEGTDDSKTNVTQITEMVGTAAPYDDTGGTMHLNVAQAVADDLAAYDILVTIDRPSEGDYTMIVVTPTNPFTGTSGIGAQDCGNTSANNVGFAFFSAASTQSAQNQAAAVLRIWGFTLGLEQVVASGDIMSSQMITPDPTFTDECIALATAPGACGQHLMQCPAGEQNSHAEILGFFGAA